jgi:4-(gamma-glutamylamino)butanal dehydrogenase
MAGINCSLEYKRSRKPNGTVKLESSDVKKTAGQLKCRTQAFLDGQFVNAASGKTYVWVNPATGQPLTHIASCDRKDVDLAVKAARRSFAQGVWSKRSPAERKQVLLTLADLLEENLAEIALAERPEGRRAHKGKP